MLTLFMEAQLQPLVQVMNTPEVTDIKKTMECYFPLPCEVDRAKQESEHCDYCARLQIHMVKQTLTLLPQLSKVAHQYEKCWEMNELLLLVDQ